ncbi:MAG: STAS domain-containing protein [Bacilli bacterium]|nr:STAS domain-containing protein [Bacilli bacterium]
MTTNIDFKKGILFIRIKGSLNQKNKNYFESEVIPVILGLQARCITLNLYELSEVDEKGVSSFIKLSNIANKWGGKVAICEINKSIKNFINKTDIFDYCFKTKNELTALGAFK